MSWIRSQVERVQNYPLFEDAFVKFMFDFNRNLLLCATMFVASHVTLVRASTDGSLPASRQLFGIALGFYAVWLFALNLGNAVKRVLELRRHWAFTLLLTVSTGAIGVATFVLAGEANTLASRTIGAQSQAMHPKQPPPAPR